MRFLNNIMPMLYYFSSFFFLASYLDFFENRYKTKSTGSQNAIVILLFLMLDYLFGWNKDIYTLILISILVYLYLHIAFRFTSKKDIVVNFVYYSIGILILLTVYSLFQCLFTLEIEQSIYFSVLSIFLASLLFQFFNHKWKNSDLWQVYYRIEFKDLCIMLILIIFFFIISIALLYFSEAYDNRAFEFFAFILNVFFIIVLSCFMYLINKVCQRYEVENELQQIKQKEELNYTFYKRREEAEKEVSYLMHDMKNHLQMIANLTNQTQAINYLHNVEKQIANKEIPQYSSRQVLQVLLDEKVRKAQEQKIKISIQNSDVQFTKIEDFDLVTIFSNLLDNAIDGVATLVEEKREIALCIRQIRSMVVITINNPTNQTMKMNESGKFLTTKSKHKGLGLTSVQNTVKKYHGDIQISFDEQCFTVTIVFH